ncbi:MAG: hypothetical protein QG656_1501, partial [Candidatus Hydrogenedentes bacterium]|nr:hypothetical protein [Candidatus Hydrogenedentota bacterium]
MPDRHLVILSGPMQGNRIPVPDRLTIGRNPNSGLKLDDLKVSRLHAVIEETRSGIMIRDLGSNNGTFVDDKPILEHYLVNGDMVRIGSVLMRYETDAPARPASSVRYKDGKETLEHSTIENLVQTFFSSAAGSGDTHDRLRDAQERLAALYRANQIFASERDPEKLFVQVMDQIAGLIPAHNGAILLKNRKTGSLDARYVWSAGGTKEVVISSSIVKEAIDSGEAVITMNATDDERFRAHESVIAGNISSAMCVPLIHQDETLGALYVDTRGTVISFGQSDLELLVALAGPAAIAIRNAQHEHEREQSVKLLERSYDDTLIVLADAIELRDHYTV